jgi:hypothetical protein
MFFKAETSQLEKAIAIGDFNSISGDLMRGTYLVETDLFMQTMETSI